MAIATTVGAFAIMALVFAYPAMASSTGGTGTPDYQQLLQHPRSSTAAAIQLFQGQTLTFTSVAGGFWVVGDRASNGTASGSLTVQVSDNFTGGYVLSVTGGSLDINGTTYSISSGSAELGPRGVYMAGHGQAGTAQFLFLDRDLGRFGSASYGILRVDLKDGASEFAARLLVTITAQ